MKIYFLLVSLFFFTNCILFHESQDTIIENSSGKFESYDIIVNENIQENYLLTKDSLPIKNNKLEGIWANSNDSNENALFEIVGDSIFYLESPDKGYFFHIHKQLMTIQFENYLLNQTIVKVNKDTLVIDRDGEIEIYFRR